MKNAYILVFLSLALPGCGTVTNFNLSSKEDINELYAPCSGPMNVYYIKVNGTEVIDLSIKRRNEVTEIYLSEHDAVGQTIVWPTAITVEFSNKEISIPESGRIGESILKENMAYYKIPSIENELSINFGVVTFNAIKHEFKPLFFKYEPRKFLMCVQ